MSKTNNHNNIPFYCYLIPYLGLFINVFSIFSGSDFLKIGSLNFAVWFALGIIIYGIGYLTNKTMGWDKGIIQIITISILSICITAGIAVALMSYKFPLPYENLVPAIIVLSLRSLTISIFAFLGFTTAQISDQKLTIINLKNKIAKFEDEKLKTVMLGELEVQNSKFKANEIIKNAEFEAKEIIERKNKIESELKELIITEHNLLNWINKDN